jgi:Zn ribbon nucleic-acid-binding protein
MITAEKMQDVLTFKDEPLTANDRCDSCSAAAKVRVYMKTSNLELMFCGHHMRKQEEALTAVAYFNPDWDTELQ